MRYLVKPTKNGWGIYDSKRNKFLGGDMKFSEANEYAENLNKQRRNKHEW